MFRKFSAVAAFCFLFGSLLLLPAIVSLPPAGTAPKTENLSSNYKTFDPPFDSFHEKFKPPEWWNELHQNEPREYPIFQLSQNYPIDKPSEKCPDDECTWQKFDFRTQAPEYLFEALKYAFAGNLEIDWRVQENPVRQWFHAPWMHTTDFGREFVHGLTKERRLCKEELLAKTNIPCKDRTIDNWAVGIYNERGAYYIGKVWEEIFKDKPDAANFPQTGFPEGTVTLKLLFTKGGKNEEADFLDNSFEWMVDEKRAGSKKTKAEECLAEGINPECIGLVRLLQIDIGIRDNRAPTGWVFGTFVYNKDAPPFYDYQFSQTTTDVEKENLSRWLKLEFVGLMYGNDENVKIGGNLTESIINKNVKTKQKLGCGGRLNGLVDTPISSCMSCHALAETEKNLKLDKMPYDKIDLGCSDEKIPELFRNVKPRSEDLTVRTFTKSDANKQIVSLDYSLQLREGIMRYCLEHKEKCGLTNIKTKNFIDVTRAGLESLLEKLKIKKKDK